MFLFSIGIKNDDHSWEKRDDISKKYYPDIYNYCKARASVSCADDITSDVFELFFEKWEKLGDINYRTWLYKTADNLIKNHYKKHSRKIKKEIYIDDLQTDVLSYDQNFEMIFENIGEDEIEEYAKELLKNLSEQDKILYDMKYVKKLSSAKIGENLFISENAVNQKLFRLREKIKMEISKILGQNKQ